MENINFGIFYSFLGEYNPKIDYLFCRHINLSFSDNNDEALWRKCWIGEISPFCNGSLSMMKAEEELEKCASLLKSDCTYLEIFNCLGLPQSLLNSFKQYWNKAVNGDISASDSFLIECLKTNSNDFINFKVAHAILCILAKHIPTIFYMGQFRKVKENIDKNEGYALQILYLARARTEIANEKHSVYSFEELKEKLLSIKDYLKDNYGVSELYIYGSYSKGNQGPYSDLDVYAISDKPTLLVSEGVMSKIATVTNLPVDGHVVDDYTKASIVLTPEIRRWLKKIY